MLALGNSRGCGHRACKCSSPACQHSMICTNGALQSCLILLRFIAGDGARRWALKRRIKAAATPEEALTVRFDLSLNPAIAVCGHVLSERLLVSTQRLSSNSTRG